MSWLTAALLAYFALAVGFLLDKYILAKPIKIPVVDAVLPGLLGILALVLVPFGFGLVSWSVFGWSVVSGGALIIALFFFFTALQAGEISRVVPFIGALVPIGTLIFGSMLLTDVIEDNQILAFVFLVLGGMSIIFNLRGTLTGRIIGYSAVGALFFGLSFATAKIVYDDTNFINGFIWIRIGAFLMSVALLALPVVRRGLRKTRRSAPKGTTALFLTSKSASGLGTFLENYAIAHGSVVIVNALQSTQYIFLLVLALLLARKLPQVYREQFKTGAIIGKVIAILVISLGLLLLAEPPAKRLTYGITFSAKTSAAFDIDPKEMYGQILDDLKVRDLRLVAYWDEIEPQRDAFDFSPVDWQIEEADKRGAKVVLAMGYKTPRWPECHVPEWAAKISTEERKERILVMLRTATEHFKHYGNIYAWQVENEPLFPFGICDILGFDFLQKEVDVVRSIDPRPIMLTDSGELGYAWPRLAMMGDIFGTTLYRHVYNRVFGYTEYWFIPAHYFQLKTLWAHYILGKDIAVAELQAEPWLHIWVKDAPYDLQAANMNPRVMAEIADYTSRTGFDHAYLWGVEWWYWFGKHFGDWDMWNYQKQIISDR